jgi:hypothetical protein
MNGGWVGIIAGRGVWERSVFLCIRGKKLSVDKERGSWVIIDGKECVD